VLAAVLSYPSRSSAQKKMYDAVTHDSVALFAMEATTLPSGDSVLVMPIRTFLPLGDTVGTRKEAREWWPVASAHVKVRGFPYALILIVWPNTASDSTLQAGVAARFGLPFYRDNNGCWHIVNDTTEVSTCSPLSR
jgi:hypothetical protein